MEEVSLERELQESGAGTALADRFTGSVLVVGLGALGCPAAAVLADSGIATLTLLDPDRVEVSNLHRQTLYEQSDIGRPKVDAARERLSRRATTTIEAVSEALDDSNAAGLIAAHDFVIDATDSPRAKFLVNDTAVALSVPFSYAGASRTGGQTMAVAPGRSACLRCVFPQEDDFARPGACSELGILGPVGGVIGALQARQALASPTARPAGIMFVYEVRGSRWQRISFSRRSTCSACGAPSRTQETRRPQPCLS